MSNKMPMPSPEKCSLRLDVNALTKVRLQRISAEAGLSMNTFANALLETGLAKKPITEEDRIRANEIIKANIAAREVKKAQKGIK